MNREEMIGKKYIYNGDYKPYKGQEVEVAYLNDEDVKAVVVCDSATTESFFSAKVSELRKI